jgi:hypothetical protein
LRQKRQVFYRFVLGAAGKSFAGKPMGAVVDVPRRFIYPGIRYFL